MISFRYHVVSIVAVFLAIGLGILAGTTVLNQQLIHNLKSRTNAAERAESALRKDIAGIKQAATQAESLIGPLSQFAESGRLTGRKVVLVDFDGLDTQATGQAKQALAQAKAVVTEISVTAKIALSDPGTRSQLATLLGLNPATAGGAVVIHNAAIALANRLAEGGKPSELPPGRQGAADVLDAMLSAGFLKSVISPSDLPGIGGPGQLVLVVAGGTTPPPVPLSQFMVPLVEELNLHPAIWVGVGQSSDSTSVAADPAGAALPDDLVGMIRAAGLSTVRMVTVDDLDSSHVGGVALVLGVVDMMRPGGQGGNYGIGKKAGGLLPPAA